MLYSMNRQEDNPVQERSLLPLGQTSHPAPRHFHEEIVPMWKRRPDGTLLPDIPAYRKMMPYLMTTKNSSVVYATAMVDMEKALSFIESPPGMKKGELTVTHLFLRAAVKSLHEFPRLNRFVSGHRLYQRNGIIISFSAKKAFRDDAPIVVIKVQFDPEETLAQMAQRIQEALKEGRSDKESLTDKETSLLLRLPRFLLRSIIWLQSALDYFNLLPRKFIETDLFYASLFVANLGSIGLNAGYHHLYEYGNISLFMTVGKIQPLPAVEGNQVTVRRQTEIKISYDERIEDGFYASRALDRLKYYVEHPEEML